MNEYFPIIGLPSQYLTYEGIKPGDIKIRPYCGDDEKYLSQINPINLETNFLEILNRIIQGIDPKKLTLGDREYIILWECAKSYSEIWDFPNICSYCLEEIEVTVDLTKIETISLPDNYKEPYEVCLPTSNQKINLRLLTVEDQVEIERYSRKHKEEVPLYKLARTIVSDDSFEVEMKKLSEMSSQDILEIRAFQEKFWHGPDMCIKYICSKCKEEDEFRAPFRFDFIYPTGETLKSIAGKRI